MPDTASTTPRLPEPSAASLEALALALARAGRPREVIQLVETWDQRPGSGPTRAALLAEARAFLDLKLVDQAWLRLKPLVERDGLDLDAVLLAAEAAVERGWPARARRLLEAPLRQQPNNGLLRAWMARAQAPPLLPPSNTRLLEREGDFPTRLSLAERFIATGSFLRARSILEKLAAEAPENERVQDLLWGLRGDFVPSGGSLAALAAELRQLLSGLDESEETGTEETGDDVTAARIDIGVEPSEVDFPTLFRSGPAPLLPLGDDDTAEVTQKVEVASPTEIRRRGPLRLDGIDPRESRHEDTQVLTVIQGELRKASEGPLHHRKEQEYDLKRSLNLAEYRRLMGMESPPPPGGQLPESDLGELDDELEEELADEDDGLVVLTRHAPPPEPTDPPSPPPSGPMRAIERYPEPEGGPSQGPELLEGQPAPEPEEPGSTAATPVPLETPVPEPEAVEPGFHDRETLLRRSRRRPWLLAGPGLLLLLLALALVARPGRRALLDRAEPLLLSDDASALQDYLHQLDRRIGDGEDSADPRLLAGRARVRLLLWEDFSPDTSLLEGARRDIQRARALGADEPLVRLAQAELGLAERRVVSARRALSSVTIEGASAWLDLARLEVADGRVEEGRRALEAAERIAPDAPRPARLFLELLPPGAEARQLLVSLRERFPDDPLLGLDEARLALAELSSRELAAEARRRAESLPDRPAARLLLLAGAMLEERGVEPEARGLYRSALQRDPSNPVALYRVGRAELEQARYRQAIEPLGDALALRPGDALARRERIRALLCLDRVEQATAELRRHRAAAPGDPHLPLLDAWVAAVGREELPATHTALDPYLAHHPADGEARFLLGYVQALAGEEGAAENLERAAELLESEPWLQARALAALALLQPPRQREATSLRALGRAPRDPWVPWLLGRAWAGDGRFESRLRARAHFERAHELAPDFAPALYSLGTVLSELGEERPAREAWERYLALEPRSPRSRLLQERLRDATPSH